MSSSNKIRLDSALIRLGAVGSKIHECLAATIVSWVGSGRRGSHLPLYHAFIRSVFSLTNLVFHDKVPSCFRPWHPEPSTSVVP